MFSPDERPNLTISSQENAELAALLRSNHPAPSLIHDLWNKAPSLLEAYSDQILRLERELERVRIARNDLKLHLARVPGRAARQSVFCPMTCLEEILGYCVPSKEDYRREGVPFLDSELRRLAKKPLLLLAQVCYRWNQIVMQTPKFSSTTALERSGACLLSIMVDGYRVWPEDPAPRQALKLLLQHSEGWGCIWFISVMRFPIPMIVKGNLKFSRSLIGDSSSRTLSRFQSRFGPGERTWKRCASRTTTPSSTLTDAFRYGLTHLPRSGTPALIPRLTILELVASKTFTSAVLANFLESRLPTERGKTFHLQVRGLFDAFYRD
ncbi:hypothetical protein MKEN_00264100 [Mycena kentingensis (nom. inval.)]|nr:hypothetical protein MKEN_00264100 [Mycena kentingensis (nom. inval.)]